MHQFMLENPAVGVLGPQMLCPDGGIGRSYMRFPTVWRSFCYASGLSTLSGGHAPFAGFLMRDFDNRSTAEVEVLNGWFLMVRRSALAEVGILDDSFFMYGEDIDWAFRFHQANWKSVYFSGARALHYGGASSAAAPTRFFVEMYRANLQYWRKHHGKLGHLAYWMILVLHHVVRAIGYAVVDIATGRSRPELNLKAGRSATCLKWLFGLRECL
jgi:GT2 family glycosyltransferase